MKLLTLDQTAERLNISVKTVRDWVYKRKISFVKVGRLVRIRESEIDDFIKGNTVPAN